MNVKPLPAHLCERPFTSAEAAAAGVGRGVLDGPRVRRLLFGVYVAADLDVTPRTRIEAARLVLPPSALAIGVTALWLHGVEVGTPEPMRFATDRREQVRRPGLRVMRMTRLPPRSGGAAGPEHAFVTAAAELDMVELVSAGDRLVRLERCTPDALVAYADTYRGPAAALARRAARMVRWRVDSVRETRLRLCLVLAGLPEPQCNPLIKTDAYPIGRVDLLFEEFWVIVEYDGDQHRTDQRQWSTDIHRGEETTGLGYRTIRVTKGHLRRPRSVVWRVHDAIVAGGYAGPAPVFGPEWGTLFERSGR